MLIALAGFLYKTSQLYKQGTWSLLQEQAEICSEITGFSTWKPGTYPAFKALLGAEWTAMI